MKSSIGDTSRKICLRPLFEKPRERIVLDAEEIREIVDLRDLGEGQAIGARTSQGRLLFKLWDDGQVSRNGWAGCRRRKTRIAHSYPGDANAASLGTYSSNVVAHDTKDSSPVQGSTGPSPAGRSRPLPLLTIEVRPRSDVDTVPIPGCSPRGSRLDADAKEERACPLLFFYLCFFLFFCLCFFYLCSSICPAT